MVPKALADALPQVILILVASVAGYVAIRIAVSAAVKHLIERRTRDADAGNLTRLELERRVQTLGELLVRIAGAVIVVVASLILLDTFNVNIGPAIAGLGIVGLAVGFGAQALIKDWLSGIFIVAENQFNAGEQVRIAGVEGVVEDFSLRRTMLRDADGTVHHVPNGQIIVASNLSRGRHAAPTGPDVGAGSGTPGTKAGDPADPEDTRPDSA